MRGVSAVVFFFFFFFTGGQNGFDSWALYRVASTLEVGLADKESRQQERFHMRPAMRIAAGRPPFLVLLETNRPLCPESLEGERR